MENLKIGTRLGLGYALILALMAIMTTISVWRLQDIGAASESMVRESLYKERRAEAWLLATTTNSVRTFALAKTTDAETEKYFQAQIAATSKQISAIQKELEGLIQDESGKQLLAKVGEKRAAYVQQRNSIFKLKADGNQAEALQLTDSALVPALDAYAASIHSVLEQQKQLIDQSAGTIDANYRSGRLILIALGALAILLAAFLAWRLTRGITGQLNTAVKVAQTVAGGDLTSRIEVTSKNEIGQLLQALKHMNDSLQQVVGQVRSGTEAMATASGQIAAGNLDLSSRTEQQASSLEETASSMEELTSTVKQNADNAHQANQLAASASAVAQQGGAVVAQVVETMESINASSKKIVDIIGVIDGIAFQTNILALNAAVEAARAGEQGRGFAVVASEVRNLAQRSASAAKEIKTLIGDSVDKVESGTRLVDQAGGTMTEIVASVQRVTDIMAEITAASVEQTSGIEQINQAIAQMDEVTQQNAALVEEAAAASDAMQQQAGDLAQVVSVFKLDAAQAPLKMLGAGTAPRAAATTAPARAVAARARPKAAAGTAPAIAAVRRAPAGSADGDWEEF